MKQIIATEKAPGAIGPYSQACAANGMVYVSGQLGIDPKTGEMKEDVEGQTRQSLENLKAILEQAGTSLDHVVKTCVFIKDMNDFAKINTIYAEYFQNDCPARACVEVARLPKDGLVEIECIAAQ